MDEYAFEVPVVVEHRRCVVCHQWRNAAHGEVVEVRDAIEVTAFGDVASRYIEGIATEAFKCWNCEPPRIEGYAVLKTPPQPVVEQPKPLGQRRIKVS